MYLILAALIRLRDRFADEVDEILVTYAKDRHFVDREIRRVAPWTEERRVRRKVRPFPPKEDHQDEEVTAETPPPVEVAPVEPPVSTSPIHPDVIAGKVPLEIVGEEKHAALVELWLRNWKADGAPQPDRQGALLTIYTGWLKPWKEYLRWKGGLAGGTNAILLQRNHCLPEDALALAKTLAREMAAVGSTMSLPVDGLLEASMFTDPDGPLSGGLTCDTAKMDRPTYQP